jgi:hypothetical protein
VALVFSVNGTNQQRSWAEDSTWQGADEAAAAMAQIGNARSHDLRHSRYHTTNGIDPIEIQVAGTATTSHTAGIRAYKGAGTKRSLNKPASTLYGKEHT